MKINPYKLAQYLFSNDLTKINLSLEELSKQIEFAHQAKLIKKATDIKNEIEQKTVRPKSIEEIKASRIAKRKKEIKEFFFGKAELDSKSDTQQTDSLIDEKIRTEFRAALRGLGKKELEEILFGNNTDILTNNDEYLFPTDDMITKSFLSMEKEFGYFPQEPKAEILKKFKEIFTTTKFIGDFIEKNNEANNRTAYFHAYKILVLFGEDQPLKLFTEYLNSFYNVDSPVHDALYPRIPKAEGIHVAEWRSLIHKNGPRALQYFNNAKTIEKQLENKAPLNLNEARDANSRAMYKEIDLDPELAHLCMEYGISEKIFTKCLDIKFHRPISISTNQTDDEMDSDDETDTIENKESKTITLPPLKKRDNLPSVVTTDSKYPDYCLVKLPINDPRAFILGEITHCCQSIGGESEKCVIDGLTRENNGFYVLLKSLKHLKQSPSPFTSENGEEKIDYSQFEIVGQGYAWLSTQGNLTFDSWENRTPERDDEVAVEFLKLFANSVIHQNNSSMLRMTIGNGGKTPDYFNKLEKCYPEKILEGTQYGDSLEQVTIYSNEEQRKQLLSKLDQILIKVLGDNALATATSLTSASKDEDDSKEDLDKNNVTTKFIKQIQKGCYSEKYIQDFQSIIQSLNLPTFLDDVLKYVPAWRKPDYFNLMKAIITLNEENLENDADVRAWVFDQYCDSFTFITIEKVKEIISLIKQLKNYHFVSDLEKEIRAKILEIPPLANQIIEAFVLIKEAGLETDLNLRERIFKIIYEYNPFERDDHFLKKAVTELIQALNYLKEKGWDSNTKLKAGILKNNKSWRSLVNGFSLMIEMKLDKNEKLLEPFYHYSENSYGSDTASEDYVNRLYQTKQLLDQSSFAHKEEVFDNLKNCFYPEGLIKQLELLKKENLENDSIVRKELLHRYGTSIPHENYIERIVSARKTMSEAKLIDQEDLYQVVCEDYYPDNKINHIIHAFELIAQAHIDMDSELRKIIFNLSNIHNHEGVQHIISMKQKLKELDLDNHQALKQALFNSWRRSIWDPSKIQDCILKCFSLLQAAKLEKDEFLLQSVLDLSNDQYSLEKNTIKIALSVIKKIGIKQNIIDDLQKEFDLTLRSEHLDALSIVELVLKTENISLASCYVRTIADLKKYINEKNTQLLNARGEKRDTLFSKTCELQINAATTLIKAIETGEDLTLIANTSIYFTEDPTLRDIYQGIKSQIDTSLTHHNSMALL